MNLETGIRPELWNAIKKNYEDRSFKSAILDSIYFLSDLIREKADLDSDGVVLVGQAFGGDAPRIKINALETETERNIQKGVQELLRGVYTTIRNPRSHEQSSDTQQDAESIIFFLDYLVRIIDASKSQFDQVAFSKQVFDQDFPTNTRYAELLVQRIPAKRRMDVFVDLYRRKHTGNGISLAVFFKEFWKILSTEQKTEIAGIISDELETSEDQTILRLAIQLFEDSNWAEYSELARIRVESKLIKSISEGRLDVKTDKAISGPFGTWAIGIATHFVLKDDLIKTLRMKLYSGIREQEDYLFRFFLGIWMELEPIPSQYTINALKRGLKAGKQNFHDAIGLNFLDDDHAWITPIKAEYDHFVAASPTFDNLEDDIPF